MSGIIDYVENLTDGEVYNELKKHGFPAGPVVGKCVYYICFMLVWLVSC
jgi:hypothetical protein